MNTIPGQPINPLNETRATPPHQTGATRQTPAVSRNKPSTAPHTEGRYFAARQSQPPASISAQLGPAARAILALFSAYPKAPPVQLHQTLLDLGPQTSTHTQHSAAKQKAASLASGTAVNARFSSPRAEQFFQALLQANQSSGLFYESQLFQLLEGRQTLSQLLKQPQAHLANPQQASQSTVRGETTTSVQIAPETQAVVRQQLDAIATQTVAFQGLAWEDAPITWEWQRHPDHDHEQNEQSHWSGQITITLPKLGQINAKITLYGQSLSVQLQAPDSSERLRQASAQLSENLLAAGLPLTKLTVNTEAQDEHE